MIAALYVETNGVYYGLPDVDPWDEARDARLYEGPWPVVAHPPCQRWCLLAPLVERIHGYRVGDDGGTFAAALEAVRRFGGVLEHPAFSYAWKHYGLPIPPNTYWGSSLIDEGWVTQVDQAAYGHAARKRTWLYAVGVDLPALNWTRTSGVSQVSSFRSNRHDERGWNERHLDHGRSSYTTDAFRDVLLDMARSAALNQQKGPEGVSVS